MNICNVLGKKSRLILLFKLFYYNHFKHITLICGKDCDIRKLHLSSCGKNNVLRLEDHVLLDHVTITIFGNNNKIIINDKNYLSNIRFAIEDDHNRIEIGKQCYFGSDCLLAALEGTTIKIGDEGMVASSVQFRTSDSHSVLNVDGNRLNHAQDILLGGHVWVGLGSLILKGTVIPKNCVVAAKSVVCKIRKIQENSLLGGVPAKVLKENINWDSKRIE